MKLPAIARENERLIVAIDEVHRGRSDLVAGMSYDLRTPLHVIMVEGQRTKVEVLRRLSFVLYPSCRRPPG